MIKKFAYDRLDSYMENKLGVDSKHRRLIWYYLVSIKEQCISVIPISLLQIFTLLILFGQAPTKVGYQVLGLFFAIMGLTMFLDGLRVSVMPLAEMIGSEMPKEFGLPSVLSLSFFLGILVTYAEPAIASLKPLAQMVEYQRAPYLYLLMTKYQELMVFAIGCGVGLASVIGTLIFVKKWPLKPFIFASLIPTIALACYMQWGNPDLSALIGMSWDCGAVTTGPVTVPVLLSLGIGVMRSSSQISSRKRTQNGRKSDSEDLLTGFGIVTLASLLPIFVVELLIIAYGWLTTRQYVLEQAVEYSTKFSMQEGSENQTPVKEILYGLRSVLPLNAALILIVMVVLRKPLPKTSFFIREERSSTEIQDYEEEYIVAEIQKTEMGHYDSKSIAGDDDGKDFITPKGRISGLNQEKEMTSLNLEFDSSKGPGSLSYPSGPMSSQSSISASHQDAQPTNYNSDKVHNIKQWLGENFALLMGIIITQIGMITFNIGLTLAFTVLGDQTGKTLPGAFMKISGFPSSPVYSYGVGITLVILFVFSLGILATKAEPALNVLGEKVDELSQGSFSKSMLIYSVAVGVGIGMSTGATKILLSIPTIYFILSAYFTSSLLTLAASQNITAIAWDSAGVTTGPVTVPFVLSIGMGFSTAINSIEGFGMLSISSASPIISVLLIDLLRKPTARAIRKIWNKSRDTRQNIWHRSSTSPLGGIYGSNSKHKTSNDNLSCFSDEISRENFATMSNNGSDNDTKEFVRRRLSK